AYSSVAQLDSLGVIEAFMNIHVRRCLIVVGISGLVSAGLLYAAQQPSSGPTVFSLCVLPFYMIGVIFSGDVHQPSEIGSFGSMFLFFFAAGYAAQIIWTKIAKKRDA